MLVKRDDLSSGAASAPRGVLAFVRRRFVSILLVLIVIGGVAYLALMPRATRDQMRGLRRGGQPVPVLATTPTIKDMPVYLNGVGTVRPLASVLVRAQVDGRLIAVKFGEGQDVAKGDVLALIDPALYQAQLDQAMAKKAQDEALLANALIDLNRYERLAATSAGSKQQADTQRAQVAQLEAQIKADQAMIDNARTTLSYTTITAPIAGRTGLRQIDEGNLVRAADATGLVTITQLKPIGVQFSLPQQDLARVNEAFAARALDVEVMGASGESVAQGRLASIDNQIDPTTGTVKLKAEFPNKPIKLWPGQFVNVHLKVDTLKDVPVVPTSAIQRGPDGPFVYVVGADSTVTIRKVGVALQSDTEAAIQEGLAANERVVTTGFNDLAEGRKVIVGSEQGSGQRSRNGGPSRDRRSQETKPQGNRPGKKPGNNP